MAGGDMRLGASAKDSMAPDVRRPATAIVMVVTRDDGQLPPMEFRGGKEVWMGMRGRS